MGGAAHGRGRRGKHFITPPTTHLAGGVRVGLQAVNGGTSNSLSLSPSMSAGSQPRLRLKRAVAALSLELDPSMSAGSQPRLRRTTWRRRQPGRRTLNERRESTPTTTCPAYLVNRQHRPPSMSAGSQPRLRLWLARSPLRDRRQPSMSAGSQPRLRPIATLLVRSTTTPSMSAGSQPRLRRAVAAKPKCRATAPQ